MNKINFNKEQKRERNKYIGYLDVSVRGIAYVVCKGLAEDILIEGKIGKYLHEDIVEVYVFKRKRRGKFIGEIINLIERKKKDYVGKINISDRFSFVIIDNKRIHVDIFVPLNKINSAKQGDKVLVSIDSWQEKSDSPEGSVKTVLGKPGEHNTEIHSILADYGLPYDFSKEIEEYANRIDTSIKEEEIKNRRDFRKDLTFTIDPADAKDFDDAISFKNISKNTYEIGIHIADVSHYLEKNSILDIEAFTRATSVYLVDRVVPMLPEILSNKACSLRPSEEKYTFSAVFEINNLGEVKNQWFGKTIIESNIRLSYEEAEEVITNKTNIINKEVSLTKKEYTIGNSVKEAILILNNIAKIKRKERMKQGAISFDKKEVRFKLDKKNNPVGVYLKESKQANKLIEEFMLLANRKVAEFIGKTIKKDTFIYRVHDLPDERKLKTLKEIVNSFGYKVDFTSRKRISESLNNLLKDIKGKKEQSLIDSLTIRSMSKAEYTTKNIGHYGLAFNHYSHFTSPIRRYPDVMVHRLLYNYLNKKKIDNKMEYGGSCQHCTEREILATKAERESIKYMQIKYMQDKTNKKFNGVISGVTEWGVYVEIIENKCEGMISIKDLKGDFFKFNSEKHLLTGQKTKKTYQLGDNIQVVVKQTDLIKKHLDFILAE